MDQEKFQPVHNGLTDFGKVRVTRVTAAPQCTKRIDFETEIENEDVKLPFCIEKLRNFVQGIVGHNSLNVKFYNVYFQIKNI